MKKAKEAIDAQNKTAPAIYAAMKTNLELFAKEESRIIHEYADAAAQGAYAFDGVKVARDTVTKLVGPDGNRGEINEFVMHEIPRKLGEMQSLSETLKANAKETAGALKALKDEIDQRKNEVNVFNSSVAMLRLAIIESEGVQTSFSKTASQHEPWAAVKALIDNFESVAGKKVSYVDADGKTTEEDLLKVARRAYVWFKADDKGGSAGDIFPDAPGIDLLILNAALAMLELKRDQTSAEVRYLGQVRAVISDAHAQAVLARELARDARQNILDYTGPLSFSSYNEERIRDAQKELKDGKQIDFRHRSLRAFLADVRKVVVAENSFYRSQALLTVALERLEHDRSITLSGINDARRRTVITKAVEGLQAYHSRGFRPEHAAQILHIAQVVALGSIALKL